MVIKSVVPPSTIKMVLVLAGIFFSFNSTFMCASGAPAPASARSAGPKQGLAAFYVRSEGPAGVAQTTDKIPVYRCDETYADVVEQALRDADFILSKCRTTCSVAGKKVHTFGAVSEYFVYPSASTTVSGFPDRLEALMRGALRKATGGGSLVVLISRANDSSDSALCRLYVPAALAKKYIRGIDADGCAQLPVGISLDTLWLLMKALENGSALNIRAGAVRDSFPFLSPALTPDKIRDFIQKAVVNSGKFDPVLCYWAAYLALLVYESMPEAEIRTSMAWVQDVGIVKDWFKTAAEYYQRHAGGTEAAHAFTSLFTSVKPVAASASIPISIPARAPAPAPAPSTKTPVTTPAVAKTPAPVAASIFRPVPLASFYVLGKDGEQEHGVVPIYRCSDADADSVVGALTAAGYHVRVRKISREEHRAFGAGREYVISFSTEAGGVETHFLQVATTIKRALCRGHTAVAAVSAFRLPDQIADRHPYTLYLPLALSEKYLSDITASQIFSLPRGVSLDALWMLMQVLESDVSVKARGRALRRCLDALPASVNIESLRVFMQSMGDYKITFEVYQWAAYFTLLLHEKMTAERTAASLSWVRSLPSVQQCFRAALFDYKADREDATSLGFQAVFDRLLAQSIPAATSKPVEIAKTPTPAAASARSAGPKQGLAAFYVMSDDSNIKHVSIDKIPLYRCDEADVEVVVDALRSAGYALSSCTTTFSSSGKSARSYGDVHEYKVSHSTLVDFADRVGVTIRGVLRKRYREPLVVLISRGNDSSDSALRRLYVPAALAKKYIRGIDAEGCAQLPVGISLDTLWLLMKALENGSALNIRAGAVRDSFPFLSPVLTPDKIRDFIQKAVVNSGKFDPVLCYWAAYLALLVYESMPEAEIRTSMAWVQDVGIVKDWFKTAAEYYQRHAGGTEAAHAFTSLFTSVKPVAASASTSASTSAKVTPTAGPASAQSTQAAGKTFVEAARNAASASTPAPAKTPAFTPAAASKLVDVAKVPAPAPAPTPVVPTQAPAPAPSSVAASAFRPVPLASFYVLGKDGEQEHGMVPIHRCSDDDANCVVAMLARNGAGYRVRPRKMSKVENRAFRAGREYVISFPTAADTDVETHFMQVAIAIKNALRTRHAAVATVTSFRSPDQLEDRHAYTLHLPLVVSQKYLPGVSESKGCVLPRGVSLDLLWMLIQALESEKNMQGRDRALRRCMELSPAGVSTERLRTFVQSMAVYKIAPEVCQWAVYLTLLFYEGMSGQAVAEALSWVHKTPLMASWFRAAIEDYKVVHGRDRTNSTYRPFYESLPSAKPATEAASRRIRLYSDSDSDSDSKADSPIGGAEYESDIDGEEKEAEPVAWVSAEGAPEPFKGPAPRGVYSGAKIEAANSRQQPLIAFHILTSVSKEITGNEPVQYCHATDAGPVIADLLEAGFNVRPRGREDGLSSQCGLEYVISPTANFDVHVVSTVAIKKNLRDVVTVTSGASCLHISRELAGEHLITISDDGVCSLHDGVPLSFLWFLLHCSPDFEVRAEQINRWILVYSRIMNVETVRSFLRAVCVAEQRYVSRDLSVWAMYVALALCARCTPAQAKRKLSWILGEKNGCSGWFKTLFPIAVRQYRSLPGHESGSPFEYIYAAIFNEGFYGQPVVEEPEPDLTPRTREAAMQTGLGTYYVKTSVEGRPMLYMDRCGEAEIKELILDGVVETAGIQKLVARNCEFGGLLKKFLGVFPDLKHLRINECDLAGALPVDLLRATPNLKVFNVAGNAITELPEGFFDTTPDIIAIDLARNKLHGHLVLSKQLLNLLYFSCTDNERLEGIHGSNLARMHTCNVARCPALSVAGCLIAPEALKILFSHNTNLTPEFGSAIKRKRSIIFATLPDGEWHLTPDPALFADFARLTMARLQATMLRNPRKFRTTNHQNAGAAPWMAAERALTTAARGADVTALTTMLSYDNMKRIVREANSFWTKVEKADKARGLEGVAKKAARRTGGAQSKGRVNAADGAAREVDSIDPVAVKKAVAVDAVLRNVSLEEYSANNRALAALFISMHTQFNAILAYCRFVGVELGIVAPGEPGATDRAAVIYRLCAARGFILKEEDKAVLKALLARTMTTEYAEYVAYGFGEINEAWRAMYEGSKHLQVLYDALMQRIVDMDSNEWAYTPRFTAGERARHQAEWDERYLAGVAYADNVSEFIRTFSQIMQRVVEHFQKLGGLCIEPFAKELAILSPQVRAELSFDKLLTIMRKCEELTWKIGVLNGVCE